ncbi:MAG: SPOR domain-containing protein [Flavobacteriales bacterium]|nr:SPOR domain-containing protein [Flavobacteriales bacterium]
MRILITLLTLSIVSTCFSQEDEDWRLYRPNKGEVEENEEMRRPGGDVPILREKGTIRYIQDERITVVDEYLVSNPIKQDGYRIQLIFGSRGEVSNARSRFLSRFRYAAYETYLPPNFRLRVGDFINRFQAEKALRDLRGSFPNAYIVRDKIEVPEQFK